MHKKGASSLQQHSNNQLYPQPSGEKGKPLISLPNPSLLPSVLEASLLQQVQGGQELARREQLTTLLHPQGRRALAVRPPQVVRRAVPRGRVRARAAHALVRSRQDFAALDREQLHSKQRWRDVGGRARREQRRRAGGAAQRPSPRREAEQGERIPAWTPALPGFEERHFAVDAGLAVAQEQRPQGSCEHCGDASGAGSEHAAVFLRYALPCECVGVRTYLQGRSKKSGKR